MILSQFLTHPVIKNVPYYYVCGEVRRGVELVVAAAIKASRAQVKQVFYADVDKQADFLDALALSAGQSRVIVLRNAEHFRRWDLVFKWVRHPGATRLIVVTNEVNPRDGKHPEIFRWFAKYGLFVECKPLHGDDAPAVLAKYLNIGVDLATRIHEFVGSDTERLIGEAIKIKSAGITSKVDVLQAFVRNPIESVVKGIFAQPSMLPDLPDTEINAALGLIELELVRQAGITGLKSQNVQWRDIATRLQIPMFVIGETLERVSRTNPNQIVNRLAITMKAQQLRQIGAGDGILYWYMKRWRYA